MDEELLLPQARANQIGRKSLERSLRTAMKDGVLSHGWLVAGPAGSGKATLAYRIARGLLAPAALLDADSFEMDSNARTFRQIAAGAHPDLFVAERIWDEKKAKYQSEITVETIRKLTGFLNRTASGGGARIAIIDTADHLNRNAANALLKALEEPPAGALLLLLSAAPGRLLPTIRSRCRRLELPSLPDAQIERFLIDEGVAPQSAKMIASHARGRPGYALQLSDGEGVEAITLADTFFNTAQKNGDLSRIISGVTGKAGEARWPIFRDTILTKLSDGARAAAIGNAITEFGGPEFSSPDFGNANASSLLDAWQNLSQLIGRGEAVNLDRGQLITAMAHDFRLCLRGRAA